MFRRVPEKIERTDWTDTLVNKGLPIAGGIAGGIIGGMSGGAPGAMAGAQAGLGAGQTLSGLFGQDEYSKARMMQGVETGLKGYQQYQKAIPVGIQTGGEGTSVPSQQPMSAPKTTVSSLGPTIESSRAPAFVSTPADEEDKFGPQFGQNFGKVDHRLRFGK